MPTGMEVSRWTIHSGGSGTEPKWHGDVAGNSTRGGNGKTYHSRSNAIEQMMEKAKYWPSNWFQLKEDGVIIDERTPWNQGYRSVNGSLSYGGNAAGQESHMHLNQTLNIKRKNLINSVKGWLKKAEDDFNTKVSDARNKTADRVSAFITLMTAAPEQITYALSTDPETVTFAIDDMVSAADDEDRTARILENVKKWATTNYGTFTPDPEATKLLALLEAVEDELIEVTADSDLRRYL